MGDRIYYVTFLSFRDVAAWIKPTNDVHRSKQLSEWIQRNLDEDHAEDIAAYLRSQKERFFNALVIGIYGGEPQWVPLRVTSTESGEIDLTEDQERELGESVGILRLSGKETCFAIDGQHRVAGIKRAVDGGGAESADEVCAIFVGHHRNPRGMERTRRLFTTLNKTARRVKTGDIIALDEDNGFAVVTRRFIDQGKLPEWAVAFESHTSALGPADDRSITSIIGLYEILRDLYQGDTSARRRFARTRPPDPEIDASFDLLVRFWTALAKFVEPLRSVLSGKKKAGVYRTSTCNHLLLRPVGQRAFAGAVGVLMRRGRKLDDAVKAVAKAPMWLHKSDWRNILWDPVAGHMLSNRVPAETFLLRSIGQDARTHAHASKLTSLLANRDEEGAD